jgi:hypothetical protein
MTGESDHRMSDSRHARRPLIQRLLLGAIGAYRRAVSPLLPSVCRFHPSCSAYAAEAIATHGAARGALLAAGRLARCHPWCEGGLDPVPSRDEVARAHPVIRAMKGRA